jgi:hypothetical protein
LISTAISNHFKSDAVLSFFISCLSRIGVQEVQRKVLPLFAGHKELLKQFCEFSEISELVHSNPLTFFISITGVPTYQSLHPEPRTDITSTPFNDSSHKQNNVKSTITSTAAVTRKRPQTSAYRTSSSDSDNASDESYDTESPVWGKSASSVATKKSKSLHETAGFDNNSNKLPAPSENTATKKLRMKRGGAKSEPACDQSEEEDDALSINHQIQAPPPLSRRLLHPTSSSFTAPLPSRVPAAPFQRSSIVIDLTQEDDDLSPLSVLEHSKRRV